MKINSFATHLLAFQRFIAFFIKFERNRRLDVQALVVAIESNHLQGFGSKSSIIQNGVGFETRAI